MNSIFMFFKGGFIWFFMKFITFTFKIIYRWSIATVTKNEIMPVSSLKLNDFYGFWLYYNFSFEKLGKQINLIIFGFTLYWASISFYIKNLCFSIPMLFNKVIRVATKNFQAKFPMTPCTNTILWDQMRTGIIFTLYCCPL